MKCWCGGSVANEKCVDSEFHDPSATGIKGEPRKLYLAGPMTGYAECNYPAFNTTARHLREAGYEVVNPAESKLKAAHYHDFLKEDLHMMLECDAVATLPRWEFSTGARNEIMVAGTVGMQVNTVGYWLATAPPLRPEQSALFDTEGR